MRTDMVPGVTFPDYELSDHTAKHRKLSELQGDDPMIVVLGRGGFCPKDRRQTEGLVQLHREMEVGYCRLVTITTNNITQTNEYRSGAGAHWPFLSDPRRIVQKDLDIAEYTDPVHNPMIPHVIVLEPRLVIHKIYNGLVLRTSNGRRTAPGPQGGQHEVPAGLGHHRARTEGALGPGPQGAFLSLRQGLRRNSRLMGCATRRTIERSAPAPS